GEHRPGLLAAKEDKVRSPLLEAGLSKAEIRALSKQLGLPNWNRPSYACLASRFPYHTQLTREKIAQVEKGEEYLRQQGFSQVRVRHHGVIARIEVPQEELPRLLEGPLAAEVARKFKGLGFSYVTADLQGYRSGAMDETL
ncbi:MAG: TIGR00268 family protein, partial [candidate division NC10 bacterium]|nr:TIGR00268 family protein [candidate division NC10 bacterium]